MKIVFLPHSNNPVYAGVRLRCLLPVAALRKAGYQCHIGEKAEYLQSADVLVVQAKWLLDSKSSAEFEGKLQQLRAAKQHGTRLFLDSFDNYFLNSSGNPSRAERLQAYRANLTLFDCFVVSSPGLVPYLREEVGPIAAIKVVGDPLEGPGANKFYEPVWIRWSPRRWLGYFQCRRLLTRLRRQRKTERQLLWFGNHGSAYAEGGMAELATILPLLEESSLNQALRLTVISNSVEKFNEITKDCRFPCEYFEWDRLSFSVILREYDLVLLPARINSFTTGKSNNRLLLPLSMGVPVMASGLPDYLPWREYCSIDEWNYFFEILKDLEPLRKRAKCKAGELRERFSVEAIGLEWAAALRP
ncbi:hypothetical protein [Roseateles koreensis]|uniref:Uncharacterized protein n=1 Tax=Roseateles koreensis TaxID=2987526 RepID=A0ABT5KT96_9BURK|nr:hypothetical protein [Roseateles koreensis]MDC8786163.1 hypothetical protein [Roseateles koreensis]